MSTAVVDASVWCDALFPGPRREAARAALDPYTTLAAPEHLLVDIVGVLRHHARHDLGASRASAILAVLQELPIDTVPTVELLSRMLELPDTLTDSDAAYVAAAEHRNAPLITRDESLLAHAGHVQCPIHAVPEPDQQTKT